MGTLTSKLTLSASNLTSDFININLTKALSVAGEVHIIRKTLDSTETELFENQNILDASEFNKSYVLLHNTSTADAEIITLGLTDNDNADDNALEATEIELGAGEFAFFPWNASRDMAADAASGTPVLEIMIFEATA